MNSKINRRDFFKWSALGGSAIAASGCDTDPVERLIPLLVPPGDYIPGVSVHYATTCRECTANCGLIVRTREGRAIKIEGNEANPSNRGAVCTAGQASLQSLYSPRRILAPYRRVGEKTEAIPWQEAHRLLQEKLTQSKKDPSRSTVYIGRPKTGTLSRLLDRLLQEIGGRRFDLDLTPVQSLKRANEICFGRFEIPQYEMDRAQVLINFGADFLETWLQPVHFSKSFALVHGESEGRKGKYIHIAPHMSLTGTNADRWLSCPPDREAYVALAIADRLLQRADHLKEGEREAVRTYVKAANALENAQKAGIGPAQIADLAKEFRNGGRSLAMAGGTCNSGENALTLQIAVNLLNLVAGNIGSTVLFGADWRIGGHPLSGMRDIVEDMNAGKVDLAIIENVNPAFALPESQAFRNALKHVPFVVSLASETDETTVLADLLLPVSHPLESWGDAFPRKGLRLLQQPVMANLPKATSLNLGDVLLKAGKALTLSGFDAPDFQEHIKAAWRGFHTESGNRQPFRSFWQTSLQKGGIYNDYPSAAVSLSDRFSSWPSKAVDKKPSGLTLLPVNSNLHNVNAFSGSSSWMVEIPHPVTQIAWDSWLEIHPRTATKMGIEHGDWVNVKSERGELKLAAYVYYGIAESCIAIPAGMGRSVPFPHYATSRGRSKLLPVLEWREEIEVVDTKVGENVMELLPFSTHPDSGDLLFVTTSIGLEPTGRKAEFAAMDGQYRKDLKTKGIKDPTGFGDRGQKGRGLIRTVSIGEINGEAPPRKRSAHQLKKRHYTLERKEKTGFYDTLPENVAKHQNGTGKKTDPYFADTKWEMVVDLDRCTGCSACVAACYAENNIAVVGRDRMALGREMSWLRIERYFEFNEKTGQPETYYSPQMCAQCDNAGCEPVCPVYATYQTPDGLNSMIYNRCVGTRYCSNNCVYKQRRFNWRTYEFPYPLNMQLNPAVSVRSKGVMEKCNFCHQRIREIKDIAKDQGRKPKDGEIKTACQQTCPSDAITFGNVLDGESAVLAKKRDTPRGYTQLEELNYKPAVTYLKKVIHNDRKS